MNTPTNDLIVPIELGAARRKIRELEAELGGEREVREHQRRRLDKLEREYAGHATEIVHLTDRALRAEGQNAQVSIHSADVIEENEQLKHHAAILAGFIVCCQDYLERHGAPAVAKEAARVLNNTPKIILTTGWIGTGLTTEDYGEEEKA